MTYKTENLPFENTKAKIRVAKKLNLKKNKEKKKKICREETADSSCTLCALKGTIMIYEMSFSSLQSPIPFFIFFVK